jgi:hypothetical protein
MRMGYMRNHLIIVSSHSEDKVNNVRLKALEIFKDTWNTRFSQMVGNVVASPLNGESSFVIFPDGSKEGWEDSDIGDNYRADFISYVEGQKYDDGSNSLRYAEIFYADDEKELGIKGN